jgi:hypothetical protein
MEAYIQIIEHVITVLLAVLGAYYALRERIMKLELNIKHLQETLDLRLTFVDLYFKTIIKENERHGNKDL